MGAPPWSPLLEEEEDGGSPPLVAPVRRGGGWGLSLALKSFYSQSLGIDAVTFMCVGYVDGTDYSEYILTIDFKGDNGRLDNGRLGLFLQMLREKNKDPSIISNCLFGKRKN